MTNYHASPYCYPVYCEADAPCPRHAQVTVAAALNDGKVFTNHPSHSFNGIDGRCYDCDCRPYGRHAPEPCPYAR